MHKWIIRSVSVLVVCSGLRSFGEDWPQWLGTHRDAVWRESGILEAFPKDGPKIRWRHPVGGGYSGPAVAQGRVVLTDRLLNPGVPGQKDPFDRARIEGTERVLCLDENTGKVLWKHEYDCPYSISYASGPRATPVIDGGKVYTLGAEGNLFCFELATGNVLWSIDFNEKFGIPTPLWGFSGHPLIDGNKLICLVGGNGSTAVAFDKNTGKELWRALSAKEPGYCPPMIFEAQGKRQLIIWHPQSVNSLNPETGELYWSEPWEIRSALSIPTPRMWGDQHLFLTSFYNGSRMFRFNEDKPGVSVVWNSKKISERDTDALHSMMSTPVLDGEFIYGICSYGQLRCIRADNGERVWETLAATTPDDKPARWANAFLVKQEDRYYLPNEKGDLIIARLSPNGYQELGRAHLLEPTSSAAGRAVLWSHPAFANGAVFMRNDQELVCAELKAGN